MALKKEKAGSDERGPKYVVPLMRSAFLRLIGFLE